MAPHQQRVIDEKADLEVKIEALGKFFSNPLFLKLDEAERERLKRQHAIMADYRDILQERIAAF